MQATRKSGATRKMKTPSSAATRRKGREVPRRFDFHWGGGEIVEEAAYVGRYTEPAIQLLAYDGGSYGIRFCYYSHDGRFQRSPMMIDSEDSLVGLRAAVKQTPRLRAMLKKLVT